MGCDLQAGGPQWRPRARSAAYLCQCARERRAAPALIGALLGHTQPSTTARYAHFFDDPCGLATERVGAIVTEKEPAAEVIKLNRV